MAEHISEEQQVESLKKFWRDNGKSIIGGIIIGIAILFGTQAWKQGKHAEAEAASMEYLGMLDSLEQGELTVAEQHGGRIIGQYPDTSYAAFAAMAMAKVKLEQGDTVAARAHLKWALDKADMKEVKSIARLRLARLLLNDGDAQQALTLLQAEPSESDSNYHELLGDIYLVLGQRDQAAGAYARAAEKITNSGSGRQDLLRMKIDDLKG